jgi:hypothetical protein
VLPEFVELTQPADSKIPKTFYLYLLQRGNLFGCRRDSFIWLSLLNVHTRLSFPLRTKRQKNKEDLKKPFEFVFKNKGFWTSIALI